MTENKFYRLAWKKLCDGTKEYRMKGLLIGFLLHEGMFKAWNEALNELKEEDGEVEETEDPIFDEMMSDFAETQRTLARVRREEDK